MPTIKEIARECGVSVATVSNIINDKGKVGEETKKRVLQVIQEMNYTPNIVAQNLKTKNTRSIGVIAEDMTVFALPDIIDGITEYYQDNIHRNIVQKEIQKLLSKQVEGIIYVASHERLINVIPADLPIPTVVAYGFTNKPEIPSVVVKDKGGAEQLVRYLISCGHKRIGVIAGKKESIHTQSRLEGYQSALFEANLLYDPGMIVYGEWDRESGYEHTEELVKRGATAIFCMNDFMAGGAYDRLDELGYTVGKNIAVAGFDNREMASYEKPELTTMGLPLHDIGYCASEVILKLLRGEEIHQKNGVYSVECKPFIRNSVNMI